MSRPAPLGANYRKLWTASVVSNLGDGVATVAYPWLASAVTRVPLHIALVGVATRLPWLLFSLPAGVVADRVDRRRLIVVMDVLRCVITLGVAAAVFAGSSELAPATSRAGTSMTPGRTALYLALLYVSALLLGFAEVMRDNAAQTLMPALVDKSQLERANGRLWGAEMVMNSLVGPPLGGALIAVGLALPFFVDSASFAVAAALLATLTGRFSTRAPGAARTPIRWRAEMAEGIRWLWRHPLLRSMGLILGMMNAVLAMTVATYVLFVQEILELGAAAFGTLLTAGAVGGVVGSVGGARVSSRLGPGASLFMVLLVEVGTLVLTGLTSSPLVVWAMFVIGSFMAVLWNVITVSLRQAIIPDRLLGRVNGVYRFFAWGMMPLGTLVGGLLVDATAALSSRATGLRAPFVLGGTIFAVLFVYALPRLNTRRIEEAKAAAAPAEI